VAAAKGHVEVVMELLNRGATVNITDKYGRTPLSEAAVERHVKGFRVLMNSFATGNITGEYVSKPVSVAVANMARELDVLIEEQVLSTQEQTCHVSFRNI
jgi:hypothetical protein